MLGVHSWSKGRAAFVLRAMAWTEADRERHLCNETHSLCLSFSQLEKGTSFAPKHSLLLSECVSVTQMREAPLCHKGKSGELPLKHWISVSLYNIYLLYILTLISIDEKGIRFPTISKIDSGTYIRCAWSTSKWWHYFNTVNISNTWCFWPRAQIVLFQTINSKFKLAQCFTELQLVMWRQCNGVNISQTWRRSQITVSAHHQLLHFFTDSLFQFFGCQSIDTFSGQCNVIPTLDLPLRNWQY